MKYQKSSATKPPELIASLPGHAGYSNPISGKEITILFCMLLLLCLIVFHQFVFGYSVYLFKDIGSDTLNANLPSYINISETLWQGNLPGWSFEQGLGQNVFPFSLSDPTTYPLYLMGSDNLAFGIVWMEIFKITCSGLLFFGFLKKLKLETNAAYIGSLLYAFSGFMIVGGSWYIFSTLGLYMALLLLSFEMLYAENKWWLFPISVSLIAGYNFVNLYTSSVFLLFYILFRVFAGEEADFKRFPSLFPKLVLLGLLGVLMSAVFSVPNLFQMIDSVRVSGNASLIDELASKPALEPGNGSYLLTLLMRTFSSDLLGNGSAYKGWQNYLEAPMSYCGLISLLLVPQIFHFLNSRQRIVYGTFLGIFIFAEIFPWFRMGFWLFQGDYFRDFSLYVSIIFILFTVLALDKLIKGRKVNLPILGISLAILLLLLIFPYDLSLHGFYGTTRWKLAVDRNIQHKIALFLVLITAILLMFSTRNYRKYVLPCLLALTLIELASLSHDSVSKRDAVLTADLNRKVGYNDYSMEAIAFINQQDNEFFRIEKNYSSSPASLAGFNDAKVQHYFGTSAYNSFNQKNYINFLAACDVLNPGNKFQTMWVTGGRNKPLLQILTGVRYLLFKGNWESKPRWDWLYTKIGSFGDVSVLKSKYALPMGIAYDTYILQSDFAKLDSNLKQIALLKAIMIPDNLANDLPAMSRISGTALSLETYSPDLVALDTEKLKDNSFHIGSFSNSSISGYINANIKQLVFFSIPFDPGWKATVNGHEAAIHMIDGGLSAILVEPGKDFISLRYTPPYVELGLYLTLFGLLIFGVAFFRYRMLQLPIAG